MFKIDNMPASKFIRAFGRLPFFAHPVAVSDAKGRLAGYFVPASQFDEFLRYQSRRKQSGTQRSIRAVDLPDDVLAALGDVRMDSEHDHLDALLDPK